MYVVGPVVGGLLAVLSYDLLAQTRTPQASAEESYTPAAGEEG